jgi:hypothetical protein
MTFLLERVLFFPVADSAGLAGSLLSPTRYYNFFGNHAPSRLKPAAGPA